MRRLSEIFDGWNGYQTGLVNAIAPLSPEQLAWKPSAKVRSVGELTRHIAMGRISWFRRMKASGSEELARKIKEWNYDPHGNGFHFTPADMLGKSCGGHHLARSYRYATNDITAPSNPCIFGFADSIT